MIINLRYVFAKKMQTVCSLFTSDARLGVRIAQDFRTGMRVRLSFGSARNAVIALCAVTGTMLAALCVGAAPAGADTFVPLPNGRNTLTTATGITVDLTRTGESAIISPAISNNGLTRTAWVSGTDFAKVKGATSGSLDTGYLIGCQVDLAGGVSAGGDIWYSLPNSFSPEITTNFTIKPGQVATVKLGTKTLAPAAGAVGYAYHNLGIQVDGCGGYAEARAFANLTVANGAGSTVVSLYGRPFSLG